MFPYPNYLEVVVFNVSVLLRLRAWEGFSKAMGYMGIHVSFPMDDDQAIEREALN